MPGVVRSSECLRTIFEDENAMLLSQRDDGVHGDAGAEQMCDDDGASARSNS